MIMFSIVTTVKDDKEALEETYYSIKNQTFIGFEWIIIDGDSNTQTKGLVSEIIKKGEARGISEPDKGIYDGMQKGLLLCNNKYVIFLNAGDIFCHDNVLNCVYKDIIKYNEINNTNIIFYGTYSHKLKNGRKLKSNFRYDRKMPYAIPTSHQAMFFPTNIIKKIGYNTTYKIKGDYALCAELYIRKVKFVPIDIEISIFDVDGYSQKNPIKGIEEHCRVQKEILKCNKWFIALSVIKLIITRIAKKIIFSMKLPAASGRGIKAD